MDDNATPPEPAGGPLAPNRRLGVTLAMVGLLVMAGFGLASRLDRSDNRIEVGAPPSGRSADTADGGATASLPGDTAGTSHDDLGTAYDETLASPVSATVDPQAITTGSPVPAKPKPSAVPAGGTGPQGTSRVILACGDTAESRRVTAFEADTTAGAAALYWSEPAGRLHPLGVGDQFPAGSRLAWAVTGVQLGPWDPDEVADTCTTPVPSPTTPTRYTVPPASVTAPVPGYDQTWTARATLACGDTADTRRVTSFDATTNGAGTASLMAWDPATGRIQQLTVGDQFPIGHALSWAIQGVYLGPWPVPQVTDNC